MTTTIPDPGAVAVGDRSTSTLRNELRDSLRFLLGRGSNVPPSCHVYQSSTISCADGTSTLMTFDAEDWDTDAMHDTSTNPSRVYAPVDGLYVISFKVRFAASAGGSYRRAQLRLNAGGASGGGTLIHSQDHNGVGATNGTVVGTTLEKRLSAGDYVEVFATQNSGGALNATGSSSHYDVSVTMRWVAV